MSCQQQARPRNRLASTKKRSKRTAIAQSLAAKKLDMDTLRQRVLEGAPHDGFEEVSRADLEDALRLVSSQRC